ncbi:aldose epimerase family protein [Planktotalea sp.]|uniref:aldose epimerase family protein n=1 Tax=Planktotalea sp. TaxID=2029877 RepID=UPI003D6A6FBC
MSAEIFGTTPSGDVVKALTLENEHLSVSLITLGASVQKLMFNGIPVVLGGAQLSEYLGGKRYFGATVGRVANRIASARAMIAGSPAALDANEANGNCLHGGRDGAGVKNWLLASVGSCHAEFSLCLPDGHMGFPGNLEVVARYEIQGSVLRLVLTAKTDQETLCCFAPHSYWNLSGETTIEDHTLRIAAARYLPLDSRGIPTGELREVNETEFDFVAARKVAKTALDHNFCLGNERTALRPVLWLNSDKSGVGLEVATTEAGVQIYDGRHIQPNPRSGLAIEPQVWPDAANQTGFPKIALRPNETYRAVTEFRLSQAS